MFKTKNLNMKKIKKINSSKNCTYYNYNSITNTYSSNRIFCLNTCCSKEILSSMYPTYKDVCCGSFTTTNIYTPKDYDSSREFGLM